MSKTGRIHCCANTLLEVLVSMTILSIIFLLLAQAILATQDTWTQTRARVGEYQEARAAFETLTRRLSQATLSAYWDYDDRANPTRYVRQSGLHFVCGPVAGQAVPLLPGEVDACGHAVFFTAPFGYAGSEAGTPVGTALDGVEELMNGWGYCVRLHSDLADRPDFLAAHPERRSFCLMEFRQPAECLPLYLQQSGTGSGAGEPLVARQRQANTLYTWFQNGALSGGQPAQAVTFAAGTRVLARHILALIISPRLPTGGTGTACDYDIAPTYLYDSRQYQWSTPAVNGVTRDGVPVPIATRNQLPPVLDVTLVALDARSWQRYQERGGDEQKYVEFMRTRFQALGPVVTPSSAQHAESYHEDLADLAALLTADKIGFRNFTTSIGLRSAKWTTDADNPAAISP